MLLSPVSCLRSLTIYSIITKFSTGVLKKSFFLGGGGGVCYHFSQLNSEFALNFFNFKKNTIFDLNSEVREKHFFLNFVFKK